MAKLLTSTECARARLLCGVHPERVVVTIMGISRNSLYHLKKRAWQPSGHFRRERPRPTDFAIRAKHMNREALIGHYHTSNRTAARWLREVKALS